MAATWRAVRRRILTPNTKETKLATRGFHEKSPAARDQLERVGGTFLEGYAIAAEARSISEAEDGLEEIPWQFRGFAYEGAGMAWAVRDGLPLGGGHWLERGLEGRGADHIYMVYVGAGWALGRLPRFRWRKSLAALTDPVLCWLALDGYGFHQAYFQTEKYVRGQYTEPGFPWPVQGPSWYADHAIDQGIGRATWFVCGTDPNLVADTLDAFPASRRPDLYAGAALAATYAGAVDEAELRLFQQRGEPYRAQIAQGSAFAATARVRAGLTTPHTELAARVLAGVTPDEASHICTESLLKIPASDETTGFELWRQRIASSLTSLQETKLRETKLQGTNT
jgi:enediyne biosynthesis protein E3